MNLSEIDVYFDSIGYSWIKIDELKDRVIKLCISGKMAGRSVFKVTPHFASN